MRIIAFYLPQFHEIPENNAWWGEGFTEWVNVKNAKRYSEDQYQPRIPLNDNYYDLSDINVMRWQVGLAKQYGIYGFCMYHYWFNGHKLLEKPVENYLKNKDIDLPFCLCWANENWTNQWVAEKKIKTLIAQKYGDKKEWREHFEYFINFFKDERYIKENGKPLLVIYRPDIIDNLDEMLSTWNEWAIEEGLVGISYAYQKVDRTYFNEKNGRSHLFSFQLEYQPLNCIEWQNNKYIKTLIRLKRAFLRFLERISGNKQLQNMTYHGKFVCRNYDKDWKCILRHIPDSDKAIPGAFVDWDNTPRKGKRGFCYKGVTSEKFELYMTALIERAKMVYKKDMIFLFAWNEWAEGGYLEPDEKNGYGYLQAIKKALISNGEWLSEHQ